MSSVLDFQALNAVALAQCPGLLETLLPGGKLRGAEYVCGDLKGGPGDSCSVNIRSGRWADFATEQRGGDMVSLIAAQRSVNQGEAARLLGDMVGRTLDAPPPRAQSTATKPQVIMPVPEGVSPPAEFQHHHLGTAAAVYRYEDVAGRLLGFVARFVKPDMDSRESRKRPSPRVFIRRKAGAGRAFPRRGPCIASHVSQILLLPRPLWWWRAKRQSRCPSECPRAFCGRSRAL